MFLPLLEGEHGLLAAMGNLPVILPCPDPFSLDVSDVERLPNGRVIFCLPSGRCGVSSLENHLRSLQSSGARFIVDGCIPPELTVPAAISALYFDAANGVVPATKDTMKKLNGLHIAHHVDSMERWDECKNTGFSWFAGDYVLQPGIVKSEGTSRARLLKLLAMVARDADARELEALLKQDLALSFHLLKLVNSAAFAPGNPITSFTQAINVLGRRQLQRWLQLLLYARTQDDGQFNPLLPLAALRASLMEGLCAAAGGDRETQEKAFMVGMFSLLEAVMGTALQEVINALKLDQMVVDALLHKGGQLGEMMHLVEQATRGNDVPDLESQEIAVDAYWQAMIKAYHWASVVMMEA